MNILEDLETSYNRKIQAQIFEQLEIIDAAGNKYHNLKQEAKRHYHNRVKPVKLNLLRENALAKGYRKDYRRMLKQLHHEFASQLAEIKENKKFSIKEEKQHVTLLMATIDANYRKVKREYLQAVKEGKPDAEKKYKEFETQYKKYYQTEYQKRCELRDKNIADINKEFSEKTENLRTEYEIKREALKSKHNKTTYKDFMKEKKQLIGTYQAEIKKYRAEMKNHKTKNRDLIKAAYAEYKTKKKQAKAAIKKIKTEEKITVAKMSAGEKKKYRKYKKYIRQDFRMRRLKKFDEKEKAIMKHVNPAYLYVMPAFVGAIFFTILPFLFMIVGSLFRVDFANLSNSRYVGFKNFVTIFTLDVEFQKAIVNTALFALLTIIFLTVITVSMAAWLAKNTRIHNAAQTMVFTPHIASLVSVSILWIAMLNPTGLINQALALFGIKGPAWLLQENTSLFSVSLVTVWKDIGYYVLIIIAGLQGIPVYVYEAAKLDKASKTTTFFKITLPLLAPTLSFVFLAKFINAFKVFAPIEIMTNGGPMGSSMVLSYWIYKVGRIGFNYGLAMAGAIVLTVMIALVTILKNIYFNKVTKY